MNVLSVNNQIERCVRGRVGRSKWWVDSHVGARGKVDVPSVRRRGLLRELQKWGSRDLSTWNDRDKVGRGSIRKLDSGWLTLDQRCLLSQQTVWLIVLFILHRGHGGTYRSLDPESRDGSDKSSSDSPLHDDDDGCLLGWIRRCSK